MVTAFFLAATVALGAEVATKRVLKTVPFGKQHVTATLYGKISKDARFSVQVIKIPSLGMWLNIRVGGSGSGSLGEVHEVRVAGLTDCRACERTNMMWGGAPYLLKKDGIVRVPLDTKAASTLQNLEKATKKAKEKAAAKEPAAPANP